ncbi:MarR family winged helix-turn-helix transcriptional regulator [Phenylobacterium sp.]|uniref:MarR family winged helix-turn-helix transcriptional regulator n=1 Tax=Phenylobacterium sp. TaxID=1871053 RepID=UPI003569EFB9
MTSIVRQLHDALLDLVGLLNRAQPDETMLKTAGVSLDRALFPLLVRIERRGPIGVGDLADLAGRDYSTVSRQVAKLEGLGLVTRGPSAADRRVNEAAVTPRGRAMIRDIDAARETLAGRLLASWSEQDQHDLARLLRRLADDALAAQSVGNRLDSDGNLGPPA